MPAISRVGLTSWSLAQRAAAPGVLGGRIARRVAAIPGANGWGSLIRRYTLREAHTPAPELTLLQRLAAADAAQGLDAPAWRDHGPVPVRRSAQRGENAASAAAHPRATVTMPGSIQRMAQGDRGIEPAGAAAHLGRRAEHAPPAAMLPGTLSVRRMPLPLVLAPPGAEWADPGTRQERAAQHAPVPQVLQRVARPVSASDPPAAPLTPRLPALPGDTGIAVAGSAPTTHSQAATGRTHMLQPPMLAPIVRRALAAPGVRLRPVGPAPLERMMGAQHAALPPGGLDHLARQATHPGLPAPAAEGRPAGQRVSPERRAQPLPAPARSSLSRQIDAQRRASPVIMRTADTAAPAGGPAARDGAPTRGASAATQPGASLVHSAVEATRHAQHGGAGLIAGEGQPVRGALLQRSAASGLPAPRPASAQQHSLVAPGAAAALTPGTGGQASTPAQPTVRTASRAALPTAPARSAIVAPAAHVNAPVASSAGSHAAHGEPGMDWGALPLAAHMLQRQPIGSAGRGLASAGSAARPDFEPAARPGTAAETGRSSDLYGQSPGFSQGLAAVAHQSAGAALQRSPAERPHAWGSEQQAQAGPPLSAGGPPPTPAAHGMLSLRHAAEGAGPPQPHSLQRSPATPGIARWAERLPVHGAQPATWADAPLASGAHAFGRSAGAAYQPALLRAARVPASLHAGGDEPEHARPDAPAGHGPQQAGSWCVPPASGAPVQRAATLDMLRPLPGALQRDGGQAADAAPGPAPEPETRAPQPARDGAGSAVSGLAGGDQVDIDALAQKVYDHLRRQMRIDRERLGR